MVIACFKCNDPITFKENVISERSGKMIPLDESTLEPHKCPNNDFASQILHCKHCNDKIIFDNQYRSDKGKMIPLNVDMTKHQCKEGKEAWKRNQKGTINCRLCNEALMFSEDHISENGKHIPIEVLSQKYHDCPKRKFVRK